MKPKPHDKQNMSPQPYIPTPLDQNPTDVPLDEIEILESENGAVLKLTWRKSPCEPHPNGRLLVNIKVISGQCKTNGRTQKQIQKNSHKKWNGLSSCRDLCGWNDTPMLNRHESRKSLHMKNQLTITLKITGE